MARIDNSPAISFFSFQDIITSVTGIMFLVMLLLTLLLLMREVASGVQEDDDTRQLREEVQALRERVSQATANSAELQERLSALRQLDAKSLPQRKASLLARLQSLQEETPQVSQMTLENRRRLEGLRDELSVVQSQESSMVTKLRESAESLSSMEAEKAKQDEASERSRQMMRFTWKGNLSKRAVLVECSSDAILVGGTDGSSPQKVFRKSGGGSNTMKMEAEFLAWAKTQPITGVYFVILAKPSAFSYAERLADILGDDGYQRGREVLPNDQVRVFSEVGGTQK